jgi:HlyD family secretion protein
MSTDQLERKREPAPVLRREDSLKPAPPDSHSNRGWLILALMILLAAGMGGFWLFAASGKTDKKERAAARSETTSREPRVQVIKPQRGGMERVTEQPGTVRAFEYAPLFTKISGFVEKLHVDRGSPVKKGQVLAEIYDPERNAAVDQALAALELDRSAVEQAEASIRTAYAMEKAAVAKQSESQAALEEKIPARDYRKKQYLRFKELNKKGDIEERVVDEELDNFHAAEGAVHAAGAGIETAAAFLSQAKAQVLKAKADLKSAQAQVKVAEANLEYARVMVQYTKILSPYDGVVIFRGESVHPGSFVRAASEGVTEPLFTVAWIDKMRTIVLIPDRDVPYCKVGDAATVQVDALSGRTFEAPVSRISESENLNDRTMRVEIDIDNPDHLLRDGMFGRATILLEKLIKNLTIPSSCLIERNGRGEGAVLVVRDGEVHRAKVRVGIDNGVRVEVVSGLKDGDQVILQPDASIADGTKVQAEPVEGPSAEKPESPRSTSAPRTPAP